jgi:hypothetical protein
MTSKDSEHNLSLRQKLSREMREYAFNFIYLALFFGTFTVYRRLVLAEYHIAYLHYGISLVQALVLAKVIMIGDLLGLGKRLENKALILTTLYKTAVFTAWIILFYIIEHTIEGLIHGEGLRQSFLHVFSLGLHEIVARCMVIFVVFIPFFAVKDMARLFGRSEIQTLFARNRAQ